MENKGRVIYGFGVIFGIVVIILFAIHAFLSWHLQTVYLMPLTDIVIIILMASLVAISVFRSNLIPKAIRIWGLLSSAFFILGFKNNWPASAWPFYVPSSFSLTLGMFLGLLGSVLAFVYGLRRRLLLSIAFALLALAWPLMGTSMMALDPYLRLAMRSLPVPRAYCVLPVAIPLDGLLGILTGLSFATLAAAVLHPSLGPLKPKDKARGVVAPAVVLAYTTYLLYSSLKTIQLDYKFIGQGIPPGVPIQNVVSALLIASLVTFDLAVLSAGSALSVAEGIGKGHG